MRRLFYPAMLLSLAFAHTSCVHEWPEAPGLESFRLKLNYNTEMTEWRHVYDGKEVIEQEVGPTYDNRSEDGVMRYVVRAYPKTERYSARGHVQEFVFKKDVAGGYGHETMVGLLPGDYNLVVWSDFADADGKGIYYDAADFAAIRLQPPHHGNTDYRDAFRGTAGVLSAPGIITKEPGVINVSMQRPLAKLELVANDVDKFLEKELTRITAKGGSAPPAKVNANDYKAVFHYVGFMPDTYSIHTDKPVDSSSGVQFTSAMKQLGSGEVSLGFDYVFVNGTESAVTVQAGIYDKEGTLLSLTGPIRVPVKRNHHTILRGAFLTAETPGGITINPGFDGDHNLIFP